MRNATLGFAVAVLVMANGARAEPARHVVLRWQAPSTCADATSLEDLVERTVGRPVFHAAEPPAATIDGVVVAEERGYVATIKLSRELTTLATRAIGPRASCEQLDKAVAVVVALMVDGLEEPGPIALALVRPEPTRPHPLHAAVEAGPALVGWLLPRTTGAAYLRGGLANGRWSLALDGLGATPATATLGAVSARIDLWVVGVDLCFLAVATPRYRWPLCGVAGGGALVPHPRGLADASDPAAAVAFVGASSGFAIHLAGPWWAQLRVAGWGLVTVPQFAFRAGGVTQTLFEPPSSFVPVVTWGLGVDLGS